MQECNGPKHIQQIAFSPEQMLAPLHATAVRHNERGLRIPPFGCICGDQLQHGLGVVLWRRASFCLYHMRTDVFALIQVLNCDSTLATLMQHAASTHPHLHHAATGLHTRMSMRRACTRKYFTLGNSSIDTRIVIYRGLTRTYFTLQQACAHVWSCVVPAGARRARCNMHTHNYGQLWSVSLRGRLARFIGHSGGGGGRKAGGAVRRAGRCPLQFRGGRCK